MPDLTWFNLIAIWGPTVNIPNLHCAPLATTPAVHNPDKFNPNPNSSRIPPINLVVSECNLRESHSRRLEDTVVAIPASPIRSLMFSMLYRALYQP